MPLAAIICLGLAIGIVISLALFVGLDQGEVTVTRREVQEEERLTVYLNEKRGLGSFKDLRELVDTTLGRLLNPVEGERGRVSQLEQRLMTAGLPFKSSEWILIVLGGSLVLGIILLLRFALSPIAFGIGFFISPVAAFFILRYLIKRRQRAFERQLGDVVLQIASALRAGYSVPQALEAAARDLAAPAGPELLRVLREMQLGIQIDEAVAHCVQRNESPDFALFSKAIAVSRKVGGELAEVTEKVGAVIRDKQRVARQIQTLTAQVRLSGLILTLLPFGLAGVLLLTSPDYFSPMFSSTIGQILIAVAIVSIAIGTYFVRRISRVDY